MVTTMAEQDKRMRFAEAQTELAHQMRLPPLEFIHATLHSIAYVTWHLSLRKGAVPWDKRKKWLVSELESMLDQLPKVIEEVEAKDD